MSGRTLSDISFLVFSSLPLEFAKWSQCQRLLTAQKIVLLALFVFGIPTVVNSEENYPANDERLGERQEMVSHLRKYGYGMIKVVDPRVIQAMLAVPRHRFVPAKSQRLAYADTPLPIGHGQTISQPYIVALMSQLADIEPGMRVLEIGTGSGYQGAILFELTDEVYTMEIVTPLAKRTSALFKTLELDGIQMIEGDGYFGWPGDLEFDRILVTAAAAHIPPPLLKQLKPDGIMVIPVGPRWGNQQLMIVRKDQEGKKSTQSLLPVRFVPLTGGKQ